MPPNSRSKDERLQHLSCFFKQRRAVTTTIASKVLTALVVLTFVAMHAVVAFAGATCCIDEAIERADACEDQAQADSLAEAERCRRNPFRIGKCLDEVYERHQERKAECRRIRDEEIAQCNI